MRASFLLDPPFVRSLDPNFYGFPIHLDCSTYGRLGFASSMIVVIEERVPLYLRQQTAPLSSGKDPNPKMLQRNLLSKWNQGADAPLLQKRGGGGNGWERRHRFFHHLDRLVPSINAWVSMVSLFGGEPPYLSPKCHHAFEQSRVPGSLISFFSK